MAWKKNKNPNRISQSDALELFQGFGYRAKSLNYFTIRVWPEETHKFYDWFHTTGTLTVNSNGFCSKIGTYRDIEMTAEAIRKNAYAK